MKSIFDTKKKNDNSTNKGIEDRQKRIDRIKQDVDETVVTFSKAIAKANDTSTKASGTIAKACDTNTKASGTSTKANDVSTKANDTTTKASDTTTNGSSKSDSTNFICCHRCTYHNATTAIECNMCGMTLETYYKNITSTSNTPNSSTKKKNNNVKFASASVAVAAQLPPTCVVESILRDDDDDNESRFVVDGAVVDFPIRCPVCTLDNHPGSSSCEACGSELTSDSIGSYQRITQVHNTNNSSKKKRNSNSSSNSNNSNNSNSIIPEAIVIPMSGNGINIVEAFPIDDQHR